MRADCSLIIGHRDVVWPLISRNKTEPNNEKEILTLTFPQLVLEVRVTPTFPVKIDAVTNKQGAAHARGDCTAFSAHHYYLFRLILGEFLKISFFFSSAAHVETAGSPSGSEQEGPLCFTLSFPQSA